MLQFATIVALLFNSSELNSDARRHPSPVPEDLKLITDEEIDLNWTAAVHFSPLQLHSAPADIKTINFRRQIDLKFGKSANTFLCLNSNGKKTAKFIGCELLMT
jgi:hypothetical protein